MFFHILKKDLKRKKVMNIILFAFLILASMLMSSSVNMLYTTSTAIDHFIKESDTADNIVITFHDENNDKSMEEWIDSNSMLIDSHKESLIFVTADNLKIPLKYGEIKDDTSIYLSKLPRKFNKVFSQENSYFELMEGEVGIPMLIAEQYGLKIGDKLTIKFGDYHKDLQIQYLVKDVVFATGLMGMKRFIVNDNDYEEFSANAIIKTNMWSLKKSHNVSYHDVDKDFSKSSIISIATFDRPTISFTYIMDLVLAGIMIIVSIFLIFISFLILRFTIVFTFEEDFKEIDIMKAIGIKNKGIKKIYMVKYLIIALAGGSIGFFISLPFSNYLLKSISCLIIMRTTFLNYILSVCSVLFVIMMTIGFCYLCTRRINKMSAIESIRQGSTGERYTSKRILKLHLMKHIRTSHFLAISDILGSFRRFIILMVTFILGTALIIIPTNVINTLSSNEMLSLFGLIHFDFHINSTKLQAEYMDDSIEKLLRDIEVIEQQVKEKEIAIELHPDANFMSKVYVDKEEEVKSLMSLQTFGYSADHYTYLSGSAPILENEVAITTIAAKYFGVGIGDTIYCNMGNDAKPYIITGLYQSMMNQGYSLRFSETHPIKLEDTHGLLLFGVINNSSQKKEDVIKVLQDTYPDLDIQSSKEYLNSLLGNTTSQIDNIKNIIFILVLGINFLITSLIVRMLLTKEIPEIAVLKSIGFKDKDIRNWQVVRIGIILVLSIILGIFAGNVLGGPLTSGLFNMMGATQINLLVEPLQVYIIYPAILLFTTMIAVITSLSGVSKTQIWEINNQE